MVAGRVRSLGGAVADLAQLLIKNESFAAGTSAVSELVVFTSELGRSGPTYSVLGRAPLGEM